MTKGTFCSHPHCSRLAQDEHHFPLYRSEGGTEVLPLCKQHHIQAHSDHRDAKGENDWQRWGRVGGRKAQNGPNATWRRNLKQYR